MDQFASSNAYDFPHWQRSSLKIEMWNPDARRRFSVSYNECYFECDFPDNADREVELGLNAMEHALKKFDVPTILRMGVVKMYAFPASDASFEDLALRLETKLHVPFHKIHAFDECQLADLAYTLCVKTQSYPQWIHTVSAGPMTRDELLDRFPFNPKYLSSNQESTKKLLDSLPALILYLSDDVAVKNESRQAAMRAAPEVVRFGDGIAYKLRQYLGEM